jgi:hypothetical protein
MARRMRDKDFRDDQWARRHTGRVERNLKTSMVGVTEGCEVEPRAGEEAVEEAGPVLHPLEPGLH